MWAPPNPRTTTEGADGKQNLSPTPLPGSRSSLGKGPIHPQAPFFPSEVRASGRGGLGRRGFYTVCFTVLESPEASNGPEGDNTTPDNAPLFEFAPDMRVGGVVAVVAHHEVVA